MKGISFFLSFCILMLMVILAWEISAHSQSRESADDSNLIRISSIVDAFQANELFLTLDNGIDAREFIIGEEIPVVYQVNKEEGRFFFYRFASIEKQKEAYEKLGDSFTKMQIKLFEKIKEAEKEYITWPFDFKNTVVIYYFDFNSFLGQETERDTFYNCFENIEKVQDMLFHTFNKAQTWEYVSKGKSWQSRVTIEYYEYFWNDSQGNEHHEFFFNEATKLKYLQALEQEMPISFELKGSGFSLGGTGLIVNHNRLDEEGYLTLEHTRRRGLQNLQIPETLTVKWEGNEETIRYQKVNQTESNMLINQ